MISLSFLQYSFVSIPFFILGFPSISCRTDRMINVGKYMKIPTFLNIPHTAVDTLYCSSERGIYNYPAGDDSSAHVFAFIPFLDLFS